MAEQRRITSARFYEDTASRLKSLAASRRMPMYKFIDSLIKPEIDRLERERATRLRSTDRPSRRPT
ncbi:MAG: hypothetical protein ACLQGP_26165 [Isosphaeraceae bacterium]